MDEARIYEGLAAVFREVFARDIALSPGLSADQVPGWDSFKQVRLVLRIEEYFGVQLHIRDVNAMKTLGDLVGILAAKPDPGAA
jgi:acyl carrier protein